jgi:hypothetical protein
MNIDSLSFNVRLKASVSDATPFNDPVFAPVLEAALSLTNGTGANQADLFYAAQVQFVGSAITVDLRGSLTDAFGDTVNSAEIVGMLFINGPAPGQGLSSSVGTMSVSFAGTNNFQGFTAGSLNSIGPGGFFAIASPSAAGLGTVTAGTADLFTLNGSNSGDYFHYAIIARTA